VDALEPGVLGGLLLAYSHEYNRSGRVVFSTKSLSRLRENVSSFRRYLNWEEERRRQVRELFDRLYRRGTEGMARDS
jgi:hypothetical protein